MSTGRQYAAASLLRDGMVLVTGGFSSCDDDFCYDTFAADLFDPATGSWHATAPLPSSREQQTSTVLRNGDVLVAGGKRVNPDTGGMHALRTAALYHPGTGAWTQVAPMPTVHSGQASALLPNGWILLASGGSLGSQVYEPFKKLWVTTGPTRGNRRDQSMVALANGDVLLVGGGLASAESYTVGKSPLVSVRPGTIAFGAQQVGSTSRLRTVTVTNQGTADLRATGLRINGPQGAEFTATSTCLGTTIAPGGTCRLTVRFSPSSVGLRSATIALVDNAPNPQPVAVQGYGNGPDVWAPTSPMSVARAGAATTRLADGTVLVAGGVTRTGYTADAEIYDPVTRSFSPTESMPLAVGNVTGTLLPDGDVFVAGGSTVAGPTASAELYDPASGTWSSAPDMVATGDLLTQTVLPDGRVLVTGLDNQADGELYDPSSDAFTPTGPLVQPTYFSTATLLRSGDVLLAGGNGTTLAQLFDPATNAWVATAPTLVTRQSPEAVRLPDGDVLLAGGYGSRFVALASAEIYDPVTASWSMTSEPMSTPRVDFTLTAEPNGDVVAAGGCTTACDSGSPTASTDLFVDHGGSWVPGPAMTTAREEAGAALLSGGQLLVVGGTDFCCHTYAGAETYSVPTLSESPTHGPSGTMVKLRGAGLDASELVHITFDSSAIATVWTRADGSYSATVTIPSSGLGRHTIRAQGRMSHGSASVTFEVTG